MYLPPVLLLLWLREAQPQCWGLWGCPPASAHWDRDKLVCAATGCSDAPWSFFLSFSALHVQSLPCPCAEEGVHSAEWVPCPLRQRALYLTLNADLVAAINRGLWAEMEMLLCFSFIAHGSHTSCRPGLCSSTFAFIWKKEERHSSHHK